MRKIILLFFILILSVSDLFSQLRMKIKELDISDIIAEQDHVDNLFFEDGPYIKVICIIENNSDTIEKLQFKKIWDNESDAEFIYCYNYNHKNYQLSNVDMFPLLYTVIVKDTLYDLPIKYYLKPQEKIEFISGISIFKTTPLLTFNKLNYNDEILSILSTLKLCFKGPNFKLETNDIEKLTINYKYQP